MDIRVHIFGGLYQLMLSKAERSYLMGKLQVSDSYKRKLLYKIRRKLTITMEDLTLYASKRLLDWDTLPNSVTALPFLVTAYET